MSEDATESEAPEARVSARDMVVVKICERRPGVPSPTEPYGATRLEFRLPRNVRRCLEEAVQYTKKGERGLNVVFDGRLVQVKGERPDDSGLVVVTDASVETLAIRAEQLRLEVGRLEVQLQALGEAHQRMLRSYAAEQDRVADSTKKAQELLDSLRDRHRTEDGLRSDKLVQLAQAEVTLARSLAERVKQQGENLRAAVNQEAAVVNEVAKIMTEAGVSQQKGGKVAAVVDALAETGLGVLDHPIVSKGAGAVVDYFARFMAAKVPGA